MKSFYLKLAAIAALLPWLMMLSIAGPAEFFRHLPDVTTSDLSQSAFAAIPFLIAAFAPNWLIKTKLPGYVGIALVVLVYGFTTFDIHYHASHGVNIGLAIIIMALPVIVTAVMLVVALVSKFLQNRA